MCKWGTEEELILLTPARLSHTGVPMVRPWKIDACIAPIVKALNEGGVLTVQSCCGHGRGPGRIDLADGRVLEIHAAPSSPCGCIETILREIAALSEDSPTNIGNPQIRKLAQDALQ